MAHLIPRLLPLLLLLLVLRPAESIDGEVFTGVLDDLARDSLGVQDIQVSISQRPKPMSALQMGPLSRLSSPT